MVIKGLVFILCGFGFYLGRFLRWNSWEIATQPKSFVTEVSDSELDPTAHPPTWSVTLLVGLLLMITYAMVKDIGLNAAPRVE